MPDDDCASRHADEPAVADDMAPEPRNHHRVGATLLARGVRWSDIVADIERDNQLRDAA